MGTARQPAEPPLRRAPSHRSRSESSAWPSWSSSPDADRRNSPASDDARISDGFISPLDLVEIGLMFAEEAQQLHAIETATAASASQRSNGIFGSHRITRIG
jgi:hypothetical protein